MKQNIQSNVRFSSQFSRFVKPYKNIQSKHSSIQISIKKIREIISSNESTKNSCLVAPTALYLPPRLPIRHWKHFRRIISTWQPYISWNRPPQFVDWCVFYEKCPRMIWLLINQWRKCKRIPVSGRKVLSDRRKSSLKSITH